LKLFRYFAHITRVGETSCYDEVCIWRDTSRWPKSAPEYADKVDFRARIATEEECEKKKFVKWNSGTIIENQLFGCQIPAFIENTWIEMPNSSVYSRALSGHKPSKWYIDFDLYIVGFFGMWKIKSYKGFDESYSWKNEEKRYSKAQIRKWKEAFNRFKEASNNEG
jgi:hypothetical protein